MSVEYPKVLFFLKFNDNVIQARNGGTVQNWHAGLSCIRHARLLASREANSIQDRVLAVVVIDVVTKQCVFKWDYLDGLVVDVYADVYA